MNKRDIFRYGFVFLTFLGTFSSYPQAVYQARAEAPNNGIISITTAQAFQDINLDLTAHYKIANDIDFSGFVLSPLAPLSSEPFTGTIDGKGFTLSNILIDLPTTISSRYAYVALMIYNNGTIRDLNLLNVKFEATQASPALVSNPPEPSGYVATYYFSHFLYQNQADGVLENISLRLTVDASIALTLSPSFTEVAQTEIYNTLFVHQNLGSISDIDFALTASYQFGFLANDYYFSFIFENDGDVSRVNLRYVPNLFSWKAEDELKLSFFVNQNLGNASLIKLFIVSDANFVVRNGDALDTTIANLAILNAGLLDQVYLYTDYTLVFDGVNLVRYAGLVDWNHTDGGIVSNLYANTNVSLVFFNFNDNPNPTLNTQDYFISGLINRNEGTLRFFYQVGSFNLFFQYVHEATQTNASLARISNGSIDAPGLIEKGISSLALKVISLATEDNFLLINTFSNSAPGSPFQVFSTLNKVNFFKLNEAFVSAYTVETDGETVVNTYIAQSDTFSFNEAHYLPVVAFDITNQTNFSLLTTKALFTNIFSTNTNWTNTQVSIHDSWVLSLVNKLTFNVSNYSIQTIGASYVVTSGVDVFLDEVKLANGTYYFTETGAYVFELKHPDFGIENNVSILVFTENHNLTSSGATFTGSFTPSFGEGMTATLNGNAYVLGTVINQPGDHTLVVSGANGYSTTYNFTIDLVVTGVSHLGSYTSGISPTFSGGTATLNGQAYTSGTSISNVGNYSLVITGRPGFTSTYTFTISHTVSNLANSQTYQPNYVPNLVGAGITVTLNGNAYVIGTAIHEPGNHSLVVSGANGYSTTYNFTISLVVGGVIHLGNYTNAISPTFSGGTATLNGQPYTSGTSIPNVGNYSLVITGRPGFTSTYTFTIGHTTSNLSTNSTYQPNYIPNLVGQGMTITLNGNAYTLGNSISEPGDHTLVVSGANGYSTTYNFTIDFVFSGLAEGQIYTTAVTPVFSGGSATINGESFISNTLFNKIGNHTLIISGRPGFTRTYTFSITTASTNFINGESKAPNFVPTFFGVGMTATLNDVPYVLGTGITLPGDHTLVVFGANGYSSTYNFTINLVVNGVTDLAIYSNGISPTFSGGTATLNGQNYTSGTFIPNVGNYTLVITGRPAFTRNYTFTIRANVTNIFNNPTIIGSFTPQINATGAVYELNNEAYNGGLISTPGDYQLSIFGQGNYVLEVPFSIKESVSGFTMGSTYLNQPITITFSGGSATINGLSINSGYIENRVGNFELIIQGLEDYEAIYSFTIDPNLNGLSNAQTYQGEVSINILGEGISMLLNDVDFENGTFNTPGLHTLEISGVGEYLKTITFTISLVFEGVEDNASYINVSRTLTFSGGQATLNGVEINSGYVVNQVGNYTLIIAGYNTPNSTYSFSIRPSITNLTNGFAYNASVRPIILGTNISMTLNGSTYNSGSRITNPGTNYLVITSPNGDFQLNITFSVTLDFAGLRDEQTYFKTLSPTFSGGTATLNGEPYVSGTLIDSYGIFELRITGLNNYLRTYDFTIKPYEMLKPEDGQSLENFDMVIEGIHTLSEITLNGVVITDDQFIEVVGNYDLLVTYQEDVILSIRFVIEPQNYIEDGSTLRSPRYIDYPHAQVTVNGKIRNQRVRIQVQGSYDVEVVGINGYMHTFSFEFINPNRTYYQTLIVPIMATAISTIGMFFLRKRLVK